VAANVRTVSVAGSHMSIIKPPDGIFLARELCRTLREASAGLT
jgi:hypothetical protein